MREFTAADFLNSKKIWLDIFDDSEILSILDDIVERIDSLRNEGRYFSGDKQLIEDLNKNEVSVYHIPSVKLRFILHIVSDLLIAKKEDLAVTLIHRYLEGRDLMYLDPHVTNIRVVTWLCKMALEYIKEGKI